MADSRTLQIVIDAKNNAQAQLATMKNDIAGLSSGFSVWNVSLLGVGAALGALGYSMVKAAADFEITKASFTSLLGSTEKANTILKQLSDLASSTPFELKDLEKSSQTLLAFGVVASSVVPTISMLGDVAMGNRDKLSSLSLAFGQMSSTGKLMGQDLLQMINAGFNPLQQISEKTGKSMAALKEEMADGRITVDMVTQAFKDATSEGGRFHDMSEKMSKTLLGQISNLHDKWDNFLKTQGGGLIMFANIAVEKLGLILDWLVQDAAGFNWVGKAIYGAGQFLVALGKTVYAVVKTVAALFAAFYDLGKLLYAFVKDAISNFGNFGKNLQQIFKAVGQALTGNFEEAGNTIKNLFSGVLSNTIGEFSNFSTNIGADAKFIEDSWTEVSAAWSDFATLKGFNQAIEKFGSLGSGISSLQTPLSEGKEKADKFADSFSKLSDKITDFKEKGMGAMTEVADKIKKVNDELNSLLIQNNKDNVVVNQDYAQAYIDQEKKVAELKAQWTSESDQKEKNALFAKLQFEQGELDKNKTIALAYQNEVAEARRVAGLSDIARAVEELNKKRSLMQIEYEEKKTKLEGELKLELSKQNKLAEIMKAGLQEIDKINAQREKMTVDSINSEIKYWNSLAESINRAKSGKTSGAITGDAMIQSRINQATPTVNLTITGNNINGTNGIEDLAKRVGNALVNVLGFNTKFSN